MIPCICIDDSNKPEIIPQELWVESGKLYHITDIRTLVAQNRILGVELHEIDLKQIPNCIYQYFKLSRFSFTVEGIMALQKLVEESREICGLDGIDIEELIERQTAKIDERELSET